MMTKPTTGQPTDASDVLEEAFLRYQESGLRLPPVTRDLIPAQRRA